MRKVLIWLIAGIVFCISLCGCNSVESKEEKKAENITEDIEKKEYYHGKDGYFSLFDEGCRTDVKSQISGTCWVTAAATSMESSYLRRNKERIEIDPLDILEAVQGKDKSEGYILKEGVDGLNIGGWAWQITETLANGFGDYMLMESEDYSNSNMETMKEMIKEKGGMNVAVNDANAYMIASFDGYLTLNDPDSDDFDHEVVLVGWDDHFPKEYFYKEANQDGAWLAQNTRGNVWGNDGYYWISYDTPFREQTIFEIADDYEAILSYDGGNENRIQTGDTTTVANVYHKTGLLKGVGTYTNEPNQKLYIKIYDENFKEEIYDQEIVFKNPGYHTVMFDQKIEVDDYAIVISYNGAAPVEGESWEDNWIRYSVDIHEKESFILMNEKWLDLNDKETINQLNVDYLPNNCCIKAIY